MKKFLRICRHLKERDQLKGLTGRIRIENTLAYLRWETNRDRYFDFKIEDGHLILT